MKGYQTHTQTGILLNANEASQNVDDNVKQEILDAISNLALNRYPDTTCHELHDLYANIMNVPSSWILSGNGSDQMLGFLMFLLSTCSPEVLQSVKSSHAFALNGIK